MPLEDMIKNIDWSSIWIQTVFWTEIVVVVLLIIGISLMVLLLKRYNIPCLIRNKREGTADKYSWGKARRVENGASSYYEILEHGWNDLLRKNKPLLPLPTSDRVIGILGKKDFFQLVKTGYGIYDFETIKINSIFKKNAMKGKEVYIKKEKDNITYFEKMMYNTTITEPVFELVSNPGKKFSYIERPSDIDAKKFSIGQDDLDWHLNKQKEIAREVSELKWYNNPVFHWGFFVFSIIIIFIMFIMMLDKAGTVSSSCETAKKNIMDAVTSGMQKIT